MGWKLGLALRQFLPSPEAPVVLVLIMIVDVVMDRDDREALELARDNMIRHQRSTPGRGDKFKIQLASIGLSNESPRPGKNCMYKILAKSGRV